MSEHNVSSLITKDNYQHLHYTVIEAIEVHCAALVSSQTVDLVFFAQIVHKHAIHLETFQSKGEGNGFLPLDKCAALFFCLRFNYPIGHCRKS